MTFHANDEVLEEIKLAEGKFWVFVVSDVFNRTSSIAVALICALT